MTTIKNKQTGETLTGEVTDKTFSVAFFKIAGCKQVNDFHLDEWEILPPPLPTGIGAVIKNRNGVRYVRTHRKGLAWLCVDGDSSCNDEFLYPSAPFTILSEGVTL